MPSTWSAHYPIPGGTRRGYNRAMGEERRGGWSPEAKRLVVAGLVGVVLSLGLLLTPLLGRLEDTAWDARFQIRGPRESSARIVVVLLDEPTLKAWPEPLVFLGSRIARVVDQAAAGGARTIGLDFVPDFDADAYLRGLGPSRPATPTLDLEAAVAGTDGRVVLARTLGAPVLPALAAAAGGRVALANVAAARDGVVRENLAGVRVGEEVWPGFAASVAGVNPAPGRYGVNYVGQDPPTFSAVDVAAGRVDPAVFRDAIVLVGSAYEGSNDFHRTPLHRDRPGVLILADAVATWVDQRPLLTWPFVATASVTLVLGVLAGVAGMGWPVGRALAAFGLFAVGWAGVAAASFGAMDAMIPVAAPLAAVLVVGPAALSARAVREVWARQQLQARFGALLPEPALAELERQPLGWGDPPRVQPAAILFTDVRGFTVIAAAATDVQALAERTNRLMDLIAGVILAHGGHVVGFLGDGLFASFGALGTREHPADDALRAAQELLTRTVQTFNDGEGLVGTEAWAIGVGLHQGEVAAGFVGSKTRHQYTLLGDTVNTASRAEGFAKRVTEKGLGYRLITTAAFRNALSETAAAEAGLIGPSTVEVKGRGSMELYGSYPIPTRVTNPTDPA